LVGAKGLLAPDHAIEWGVDERVAVIRAALRDLEPDEKRWKSFSVLVIPENNCADLAVLKYLQGKPRPYPIPLEGLSYTVRHVGNEKLVIIDLRRIDSLSSAVDAAFKPEGEGPRRSGFFRA